MRYAGSNASIQDAAAGRLDSEHERSCTRTGEVTVIEIWAADLGVHREEDYRCYRSKEHQRISIGREAVCRGGIRTLDRFHSHEPLTKFEDTITFS